MKSHTKQLRENMTEAEKKLWFHLRDRRFCGCKFRRQHLVGPYVVDFYCFDKQLIIEVDGGQHMENEKIDEDRSRFLEQRGYSVLRFWNNDVLGNIDGVLLKIKEHLGNPSP